MPKKDAGILREVMVETIDRAFDHRSWHGPNLTNALHGVSFRLAAKSFGKRKTIWQQARHAAYWKRRTLLKLGGDFDLRFPLVNWTPTPRPSESLWRAEMKSLRELHAALRKIVVAMPESKLRSPQVRFMLEGIAGHDIYHAAQIKSLRKSLGR